MMELLNSSIKLLTWKKIKQKGIVYQAAEFREQGTNFTVYLQIFDDAEYGTRIVFTNGTMIQFTN